MLPSFRVTALTDGRRFSPIERMREDPTIPDLFGMEAVVGDDTVRHFFQSVDPVPGAGVDCPTREAPVGRAAGDGRRSESSRIQIVVDPPRPPSPKKGMFAGRETCHPLRSSLPVPFIEATVSLPAVQPFPP